jgi:uncharacterized lipoprotein YmbA
MMIPNQLTRRRLLAASALGLMGVLAGCNVAQPAQDDPTRYFVLTEPAATAAATPGGARIGLRSVHLEGYLKHRERGVRTGANEVEFRDYRRWAEPIDVALGRVLRASLMDSSGVAQVVGEPFPLDLERDYDVAIEVRRCEGIATRSEGYGASFVATFEVSTTGANPRIVAHKTFVAPGSAWDGHDFGQLASLLSADAAALGQEIAAAIAARN